jgi:hypothetical protein
MKLQIKFKMAACCSLLGILLMIPVLVQAKGEMGAQFKELKMQIFKKLQLPADKEKALMGVEDKFAAERTQLIAGLKQSQKDLQAALAEAKPDESKIKGLVTAITDGQDKLFASFKAQRDEELSLLNPVEQGKYLQAIINWRHTMMEKCMQEGAKMPEKSGKTK